jgi:hypothetical protein
MRSLRGSGLVLIPICLIAFSCASSRKKTEPELSHLIGKKVALIEVDGEATPRQVVEVALINQLVKRGTFEIVPKQEVTAARVAPDIDLRDGRAIAKRAGADFALVAQVVRFDLKTRDGYDSEVVEDSEMAAERGENERKTERVYKARSQTGDVAVRLEFTDVQNGEKRSALAEATDTETGNAKSEAIHLSPGLRFLEKIANTAFQRFFEKYQ